MQLGMPTPIEAKDIRECAGLCAELGLDFIELNMNLPEYQLHSIDAKEYASVAKEHDIYYTIHLDENFNVCDFNPDIAKAYADTAFRAIELAKQLGIPVINMHLSNGVYFTMPEERIYLFDRYIDTYLASLVLLRKECERRIAGHDIIICIENSDGWNMAFSLRGIDTLLKSRIFNLTLDTGHNFTSGGGDEDIIMERGQRLRHMHLHDAAGKKNHLVLGAGEIDIKKYLSLAEKNDIRAVIETKTIEGLKRSVDYIKALAI